MKNLMPEVAKLLGVEIGEEFKIDNFNTVFRLNEYGSLEIHSADGKRWVGENTFSLRELLLGNREIIKMPWEPKQGELYWTVEEDSIFYDSWDNDMMDYSYLKLGNCFRTKEEAEANADRIRKEIMG